MFGLVLVAATISGGEMAAQQYHHSTPGCGGGSQVALPQGGAVQFFWAGPVRLTEGEEQEWAEYLSFLEIDDRRDAQYYWTASSPQGKRALLNQVRLMRAKRDETEAKTREYEETRRKIENKKPETDLELKKPTPKPDIPRPEAKKPTPGLMDLLPFRDLLPGTKKDSKR